MQTIALLAASALPIIASAMPALERRQAPAINKPMADGYVQYPDVPQGGGNDPWVTWLDPLGNWHTQQVNDPTNLLNGKQVVTDIANVNICGGSWAFLYQVNTAADYPACGDLVGSFNGANGDIPTKAGYAPRVAYKDLQYGKCPKSVYHFFPVSLTYEVGVDKLNTWQWEHYAKCEPGYVHWGQDNDRTHGTSSFPNGMKVGYCCFSQGSV